MEQLKTIKQTLIGQVQSQMGNLEHVNAKELGEVVDMVKDLEEAIYYCTIVEAMEHKDDEKQPINNITYYTEPYPPYYYRDIDRNDGRMYYTPGMNGGGRSNSGNSNSNMNYSNGTNYYQGQQRDNQGRYMYSENYPSEMMRDSREGQSPRARRMYMESKEMHQDSTKQMQNLEKYMHELTDDVLEMVEKATPEEKQVLKTKMNLLVQKIV